MNLVQGVMRASGCLCTGIGLVATAAVFCVKSSIICSIAITILSKLAASGGVFISAAKYQTLAAFVVQEPLKATFIIQISTLYFAIILVAVGVGLVLNATPREQMNLILIAIKT